MTHLHGRVDGTHREIVRALESVGAMVVNLSEVGNGCPDVAVIHRGHTHWVEIKSRTGKLRESQIEWHARAALHGAQVAVVRSVDEALALLGVTEEAA